VNRDTDHESGGISECSDDKPPVEKTQLPYAYHEAEQVDEIEGPRCEMTRALKRRNPKPLPPSHFGIGLPA